MKKQVREKLQAEYDRKEYGGWGVSIREYSKLSKEQIEEICLICKYYQVENDTMHIFGIDKTDVEDIYNIVRED